MVSRAKYAISAVSLLLLSLFCSPAAAEPGQGVAVWDLEDLSPGGQVGIADILTAQLCEVIVKESSYAVVERSRLRRLLEEQLMGSSKLADPDYALKLGKLTGARFMVFGSYLILGPVLRVDIRLVEVETGRVLKAFKKEGTSPDLNGVSLAVKEIAKALAASLEAGENAAR